MNRKVLVMAVACLAVAMLATPLVCAAKTTKLITVTGTFYGLPGGTWILDPAGKSDNTILTIVDGIVIWEGDIAGPSTYSGRTVLHAGGERDNKEGVWTITATVSDENGVPHSGTLFIKRAQANWRIIGGTDGLANLHGEGTSEDIGFPYWAYTGQVHFDP